MDSLDYEILGHASSHLLEGDVPKEEEMSRIQKLIKLLLSVAEIKRKSGWDGVTLFWINDFKPGDAEEKFFKETLIYSINGMTTEYLEKLLRNRLAVMKPDAYETYLRYIIMIGCIELNEGTSPQLMEEILYSMLPDGIERKYVEE